MILKIILIQEIEAVTGKLDSTSSLAKVKEKEAESKV